MGLLLTIGALLALVELVALVREVRRDGLGSRPAPASHLTWSAGTTLDAGAPR
ncbi:hypothetical protein [Cellulomonas massiliensis]|uniref:hypothetical protein n=1 Tax=Cellulomonas massiliensis TaxID=1465811 RepID=UPI0002D446D0|nr:hypothetical protein [Cellulomonas massiliensis]